MLVVEVIELRRILDLLMTLDATYCDVQLIYGSEKYPKSRMSTESDNLKHWKAQNVIPFQVWEVEPWTFSCTIQVFNFLCSKGFY
jgi:hypothetical protein